MTLPCTISNMSRLLPGDDGFYCGRYALGEFAVLFGVGIGVGLAEHSFGWGLAASDADVRGYRSHAAASGRSRSQVDRAGAPCDITRYRAAALEGKNVFNNTLPSRIRPAYRGKLLASHRS